MSLNNLSIGFGSVIGIIGGGQLGRMTALAAANLGFKVHIYTDITNSPASQVAFKTTIGDYSDLNLIKVFAKSVDVVTFEFENIPHKSVEIIENYSIVRPGYKVLHLAQNRIREKEFCNSLNIQTAPFAKINSLNDLKQNIKKIGPNAIVKTNEFGYDGKGQIKINSASNLDKIFIQLNSTDAILEGFVDFDKEISVIALRSVNGEVVAYPAVENIHKNGILDKTIAPAQISEIVKQKAKEVAEKIITAIDMVGILAIEMFVTKDGDILVNEIAPRPHNSGHWTMDGCYTCQFEQFVRAVCGLKFANMKQHSKIIMHNLIGDDIVSCPEIIKNQNNKLYLYAKDKCKNGRKMGHVNEIIG